MIVDSVLTLDTGELTPKEWRRLFNSLRFKTDDETVYEPWMIYPHRRMTRIPRGAWGLIPDHVEYEDRRVLPKQRELVFKAELDSEGFDGQFDAVKKMIEMEQGIVVAQPGFGKTNVVLAFACVIKTPTLVLVHTEDILQQWLDRIADNTDAKPGVIRGKDEIIGDISVATVQTFRKRLRITPKLAKRFGAIILDEAHHAPANTFDEILNEMPAYYRFGVTATDKRADKKHPYMTTVLGPVVYRHKFVSKVPVEVVPVKSHRFYYGYRGTWDWRNLLNALKFDQKRNMAIAKLVIREIKSGKSVLVLSREIDHLEAIRAEMMIQWDENWYEAHTEILAARLVTKPERKKILDKFRAGEIKCILATQLADEALDVPILSRVFLTFPGKHDGRIIQQVGRALREHPEKSDALIYDVVDDRVGVLRRQWMERKRAYKAMGINVRKVKKK